NATNYWVDVVFSPTSNDQAAPVISEVRQTTIDAANAVSTWATNEQHTPRVEYSTSSTFPLGNTLAASVPGFATTHRVALANLSRNTTYFYRIVSSDRTGNTSTKDDSPS